MTLQAPTRITIEVHHGGSDVAGGMAHVRVVPETQSVPRSQTSAQAHEYSHAPAEFDPGECLCLDDVDCHADHAND